MNGDVMEMTVLELVRSVKRVNAGDARLAAKDEAGAFVFGVYAINDAELNARIEAVLAEWDKEVEAAEPRIVVP